MKIVILGKGKSGTTALLHMIAAAFPECRLVPGGFRAHARDRARADADPNASFATKFTYNDDKGRSFGAVLQHLSDEAYDKKIWVARDPRDNAVSNALYRWRLRHGKSRAQFRQCLERVRQKEQNPTAVPFHEIYRWTGDRGGPENVEELATSEGTRYERMLEFVRALGSDWFIFKYEDMVDRNLDALSAYLGREIGPAAELPLDDRLKVRTKGYGDWRNWFVQEDVEIFRPIYTPYMNLVGYDSDDWALNPDPTIDSTLASEYMELLDSDVGFEGLPRVKQRVERLLGKATSFLSRRST
jgi:hypothetical protein